MTKNKYKTCILDMDINNGSGFYKRVFSFIYKYDIKRTKYTNLLFTALYQFIGSLRLVSIASLKALEHCTRLIT